MTDFICIFNYAANPKLNPKSHQIQLFRMLQYPYSAEHSQVQLYHFLALLDLGCRGLGYRW